MIPLYAKPSSDSKVKLYVSKRRKLDVLESILNHEGLFLNTPGGYAQVTGTIQLPKWCAHWERQVQNEIHLQQLFQFSQETSDRKFVQDSTI